MTRASGIGPLPRLLEKASGVSAVEAVFRSVQIPVQVLDHPELEVPFGAMVRLFDSAAKSAGDPLFGLRVGLQMSPGDFGPWIKTAKTAPTLRHALDRLSAALQMHQPEGAFSLDVAQGMAVWTYIPPDFSVLPIRQHADHVLPVMIAFCRSYLGAEWLPVRARMMYADPGLKAARFALLAVPFAFDGPGVAICFPDSLLGKSLPVASGVRDLNTDENELGSMTNVPSTSLPSRDMAIESIVALRILDGQVDIEGAAALANISVRSLQRSLSQAGTTYSDVLNRVRDRKAREFLLQTDMPVTGIAYSLGYSDPANFTRAFVRRNGTPPQHFRTSRTM
ncbi:AraC family transcriptional regulator (plasmid) [Rhodobacteraceae bacterium SC52]|nr:AraC family transcriptional regulator [Rhodobacteraceae bacterium SC52]